MLFNAEIYYPKGYHFNGSLPQEDMNFKPNETESRGQNRPQNGAGAPKNKIGPPASVLTTRIFTQYQRTYTLSANKLTCSSITTLLTYPPDTLQSQILSNLHCYASKITEIFQIFLHFSHDGAQPFVSSMFRSRENFHQSAHKSATAER